MKQKGQRFDTQALTQEAQALTRDVVTAPFRLRTYRLIRKILIGFILVSIANVLFAYFFYTPKMYRICLLYTSPTEMRRKYRRSANGNTPAIHASIPQSFTHPDVYKRQAFYMGM